MIISTTTPATFLFFGTNLILLHNIFYLSIFFLMIFSTLFLIDIAFGNLIRKFITGNFRK